MLDQKGHTFPERAWGPQDALKFDGPKQKCQWNLQVIKDSPEVLITLTQEHRTGGQTLGKNSKWPPESFEFRR